MEDQVTGEIQDFWDALVQSKPTKAQLIEWGTARIRDLERAVQVRDHALREIKRRALEEPQTPVIVICNIVDEAIDV